MLIIRTQLSLQQLVTKLYVSVLISLTRRSNLHDCIIPIRGGDWAQIRPFLLKNLFQLSHSCVLGGIDIDSI